MTSPAVYARSLRDVALVIGLDFYEFGRDAYLAIRRPKPVVREVLHWTDGIDD